MIRTEDCSAASPRSFIRAAQANTSVGTVELLAELFDNSIDAGATRIESTIRNTARAGQGTFSILDDGSGAPSIGAVMRQASSTKSGEDTIGRFGVGAKDCIYGVGGLSSTLDLESRSQAGAWRSTLRWALQDTWLFPQDDCGASDLSITTQTGFLLRIERCHRKMPSAVALKKHLSRIHWPWLEQRDHTILVNGEAVEPPEIPATDERFDAESVHEVDADRGFTLFGGVLNAPSELNGVTVFCGNRAIYVADAIGTGDYSRGGIFALVRLIGPWSLDRNKNGLEEVDAETLRAALESILELTLREASERMRELDDADLLQRLNDAFVGAQIGTPERPGSTDDRHERRNAGTKRKVRTATSVRGPGDAKERRSRRRGSPFRIDFVQGDESQIGSVDADSRRIYLYRNNPSVAEVKARENDEALLFFAASLLADHASKTRGELPFAGAFANLVATILQQGTSAVDA